MKDTSSMNDETELLVTSRFRVAEIRKVGSVVLPKPKAIVRHPGAVVIIPVLDGDQVCLIRNFRAAVGDWLLELPAGTCEPPEPIEQTAAREIKEETGYTAGKLELLNSFFVSPGILDEKMHMFLATDLTAGQPAREEGEMIENQVMPISKAFELAMGGKIADAKTIVGLTLLMHRQGRFGQLS